MSKSKIDYMKITLDKPSYAVYLPGQKLSGTVYLKTNESFKINFIKLEITGKTMVQW